MFRVSMPIVLLTLAACAPVAPVESAADAPAGASTDAASSSDSSDGTTAAAPGGVSDGGQASSDGAPGAVEGGAGGSRGSGSGEVQPVPPEQIRVGPGLDEDTCKADAAQGMIGRSASEAVVKDAMRVTGAKSVRVIPHDGMVTMDYRGDRLNIQLDEQGKIVAITCG
jgi:Peptidase inhibitor I78 family